jgi:hypothetical protein
MSGFVDSLTEDVGLVIVLTRPPESSDMYLAVPLFNRPARFLRFDAGDKPDDDLPELSGKDGDTMLLVRFEDGDVIALRFMAKAN